MTDMQWRRGLKFLQHKEKVRIIQSVEYSTDIFFFFLQPPTLRKVKRQQESKTGVDYQGKL